jgi:hypothetical protein
VDRLRRRDDSTCPKMMIRPLHILESTGGKQPSFRYWPFLLLRPVSPARPSTILGRMPSDDALV